MHDYFEIEKRNVYGDGKEYCVTISQHLAG